MNNNSRNMQKNIFIISAIVICITAICVVVYMIGFNNANKQHEDELKEIYSEIKDIKDEQKNSYENNKTDESNDNNEVNSAENIILNVIKENKKTEKKGNSKLVIGFTYYEPYNYFGEKLVGFDTELARYVCKDLGYEPVFVNIDWEQNEEMLDSGEIDCVWNGMGYNDDRTKSMDVTNVYLELEAEYEGNIEIEKMVIGLKKGNSLVNELNYALAKAEQDGVIDDLKVKYNIQ